MKNHCRVKSQESRVKASRWPTTARQRPVRASRRVKSSEDEEVCSAVDLSDSTYSDKEDGDGNNDYEEDSDDDDFQPTAPKNIKIGTPDAINNDPESSDDDNDNGEDVVVLKPMKDTTLAVKKQRKEIVDGFCWVLKQKKVCDYPIANLIPYVHV